MRFHTLVIAMALALFASPFSRAIPGPGREIKASRNPITAGESVTLTLPFNGAKVTVSGGGYKNTVVTGKKSLVVSPRKSTRYTFDVRHAANKLPSKYFIDIEVVSAGASGLIPYAGVPGWRVHYLKGWKCDKAAVSSSTIVYFQKADDSVERMAVATMPISDATTASLAERVKKDFYGGYDELEILSEESVTACGAPASLITFSGNPSSHPGVRTQSLVLVLAHGGRGYVVSARTHAAKFTSRKAVLDSMLRSFTVTGTETANRQ